LQRFFSAARFLNGVAFFAQEITEHFPL